MVWEIGNAMAVQELGHVSPPPQSPLTLSLTLSTVHSSPLASGTLPSYPLTSSPFTSLPTLSDIDRGSTASLDLFEDFEYSEDMDEDFRRIDMEAARAQHSECDYLFFPTGATPLSSTPPPTPTCDQKTWVVFHSKIPGIYNDR